MAGDGDEKTAVAAFVVEDHDCGDEIVVLVAIGLSSIPYYFVVVAEDVA